MELHILAGHALGLSVSTPVLKETAGGEDCLKNGRANCHSKRLHLLKHERRAQAVEFHQEPFIGQCRVDPDARAVPLHNGRLVRPGVDADHDHDLGLRRFQVTRLQAGQARGSSGRRGIHVWLHLRHRNVVTRCAMDA